MSNIDLATLSNAQLEQRLDTIARETAQGVLEICLVIQEMRKRGMKPSISTAGSVFRHWYEIATGKLDPQVALGLDYKPAVDVLKKVPITRQQDLVLRAEPIAVVSFDVGGKFKTETMTIHQMDGARIAQVFDDNGAIKSVRQQQIALRHRAEPVKATRSIERHPIRQHNGKVVIDKAGFYTIEDFAKAGITITFVTEIA